MAQIAATAGEYALAGEWFEAAAREQSPNDIAADALAGIAALAAERGELEKAAGFYEQLLQRFPEGQRAA
jgi:TolA-binding protein